jgi:rubrerythrin
MAVRDDEDPGHEDYSDTDPDVEENVAPLRDDILDETEIGSYDESDGLDRLERYHDRGSVCATCGFAAERIFSRWRCPDCDTVNEG